MTRLIRPTFTKEELDEEKTGLIVGYKRYELIPGPDFSKPFKNAYERGRKLIAEKINGIAKRRAAHEQINDFGWARYEPGGMGDYSRLVFGVKFVNYAKNQRSNQKIIQKYNGLLLYLLASAGWKNIVQDLDGECVVTLNNEENIRNLYELSSSIGFYHKGELPDIADLKLQEIKLKYDKQEQQKSVSHKTSVRGRRR